MVKCTHESADGDGKRIHCAVTVDLNGPSLIYAYTDEMGGDELKCYARLCLLKMHLQTAVHLRKASRSDSTRQCYC